MPDQVGVPLIDEQELQIHKLYRERIVQEDGLINHRMMWMVLSQAFILAFWGVVLRELFNDHQILKYAGLGALDAMGLLFSAGSYLSIRAAQREIEELRDRYLEFYPLSPDAISNRSIARKSTRTDILPRLTGRRHFHRLGHIVPRGMPIILFVMWIGLSWATILLARNLLQGLLPGG